MCSQPPLYNLWFENYGSFAETNCFPKTNKKNLSWQASLLCIVVDQLLCIVEELNPWISYQRSNKASFHNWTNAYLLPVDLVKLFFSLPSCCMYFGWGNADNGWRRGKGGLDNLFFVWHNLWTAPNQILETKYNIKKNVLGF